MMAESQKRASSPVISKEKSSLIADVDFGKDFLSSWNSMSGAENDAMDFDFGTVSKGKKKAFNFDKLDVDFSLDGDLDKISSFQVDISDLDISSPPKKAGKPKERSKEESVGGNHQQKRDRFTFPFDFTELDSFSFESSLVKEGKKINKNKDGEEALNRSECQGSGIDLTDGIGASVSASLKPTASGGMATSKIENLIGGLGDVDSMNKNRPSNPVPNDNGPSKSATVQNQVASEEIITLPEKTTNTHIQETDEDSHHHQEKITFQEPYAQETLQDISIQSASENESTQNTASEIQVEACSMATEVTSNAGGEQDVNFKSVDGPGLNCEDSVLENSPPHNTARSLSNDGKKNRFRSSNKCLVSDIDGGEPAQGDLNFEDASTTSDARESMQEEKAKRDNQNANAELHLAPLSNGTTVNNLIQVKKKETGVMRSKFSKRSDEKESQQTLSTHTKLTMFGRKKNGSKEQAYEGRDGTEAKYAQSGSKLVRILSSHSGELNRGEPVQPGSTRGVRGLKGIGDHFNADGTLNGNRLIGSSRINDREVTNGEPVQKSEENVRNLSTLSSCFNLSISSEQRNKSTTQKNCTTPRLPSSSTVSIKNSNDICGEGNTTSPLKADRSLLDISRLKISRTIGVNHLPSTSTFQKQINSLRNTKHSMELQGSAASNIAHSVGTDKQTPPTLSVKRKTFEASNADMLNLNPSKRFSQSPTEIRNVRELSKRVVDKEVNHENLADSNTNSAVKDCQTFTLDIPRVENLTELQIPLVMENDDNVEKAEAYAKELEDICSMLKKKHEEAKEILVRAIVNNNNLLMLNHPIYQEKIRKVQKFAAQMMSKELHT